MSGAAGRPYQADPSYRPSEGRARCGWEGLAASVPDGIRVLAVDGPVMARWGAFVKGLRHGLEQRRVDADFVQTARWLLPWPKVKVLTSSTELADDPDFDRLPSIGLAELFQAPARPRAPEGVVLVVYGPGAALVPHDLLWYADLPKRYAEASVTSGEGHNLGQPRGDGPATTKRLFFVDWPLLDRHRDTIAAKIDCWVDMQDPARPSYLDGKAMRATLSELSRRPFRTRPTFNTTPWGGHWAQRQLGHNPGALNTALGYELIAPEAGVLVGQEGGPFVELPFQLAVSLQPEQLLGLPVHATFGTSFPVRFDYLDTFGGGNLSVHCHPRQAYMRSVFGWPYTQHESYYLMVGAEDQKIFLGLREGVDLDKFHKEAEEADQSGTPLEISNYVPDFPANQHQLFLIPAGTPHGSGAGNVVLEVSATPYLYSLRFYDWLRRDSIGLLRPVHVEHAFANLDTDRTGAAVARDLLQRPRVLRRGEGWREELLGRRPEMFFEVRRTTLGPGAVAEDTAGETFHVLNVVEGAGVVVEPRDAPAHLAVYAETIVVPAAVGRYKLRAVGGGPVMVVKALVPKPRTPQ
ncbi:MAG: class I mannose-6-phosphate isomerase [Actinomycetota bacterium]|jgi:mannose-6-phosphate isomerase class I|nr:class I mannose-6-phosphate isomerase [Actinomycetota bacterium]